jgi:hypothetical protein
MSRLETGQRGASALDIHALSDLYEVDEELRVRLAELAAEGKQRPWWQPYGLAYTTYQGLETSASSIEDYALGIMPGLLQTADYAREVVRATARGEDWTPADIELLVAGRMLRQRVLEGDDPPHYTAVIDEAVLRRLVGSPAIMLAQLERLLGASQLPSVDIRVISLHSGPLPAGNNKFIILRFESSELPTIVYIEGLTGDQYLDKPQDVRVYARAFSMLSDMALSTSETRARITAICEDYKRLKG